MAEACSELDEGAKLEEATTCLRDKLLINFLFHRDLRVSETLSLRPEDIDYKAGTISILNLQSRINLYCPQCDARLRKSDNFCPKCGEKVAKAVTGKQEQRRVRTILMDKETSEALKEYFERGGSVMRNGKMVVFGISRNRVYQVIKECAQRAGLKIDQPGNRKKESHRSIKTNVQ